MDLSGSWKMLAAIAQERLKHNKTSHHVSEYGTDIELIGAAGELAARRFLNLEETLHIRFDNGVDMRVGGYTIDVKATMLTRNVRYRYLQWPYWKPVRSSIILLTAVSIPNQKAIVIGYAFKHEIERAPINLLRDFPCHEIPVARLHPASELLTLQHAFLPKAPARRRAKHHSPGPAA
jgi:hypothetical protein